MLDLDYIRKYTKTHNKSASRIERMSEQYSRQYDSAISPFDVVVNSTRADNIYMNDVKYSCLVDFTKVKTRGDFDPTLFRVLQTKIEDNFVTGNLIYFENRTSKNKIPYLLIHHLESKEGYDLFFMQRANGLLAYQDTNYNIIETPCIRMSATLYSDGIDVNSELDVADDLLNVTVGYNEEIFNFEIGRRFIFDNKNSYELTMVNSSDLFNSIDKTGLLKLTFRRCKKEDSDRLDLNIANYMDAPEVIQIPNTPFIEIVLEGKDKIKQGAISTFTAKTYQNGIELFYDLTWSISNENAKIIQADNDTCKIEGLNLLTTFTIRVEFTNNSSIYSEKEVKVISLF